MFKPYLQMKCLCRLRLSNMTMMHSMMASTSSVHRAFAEKCSTKFAPNILIHNESKWPADLLANAKKDAKVVDDFVTMDEEEALMTDARTKLKRLRYESAHWDDAIHQYRETEMSTWSSNSEPIIARIRHHAMPPSAVHIPSVHVLDLHADGYIKAHIDSVRYCGDVIAGVSLLSPAVMRFRHEHLSECVVDVLLARRSLYVIGGVMRYAFTHEVLGGEESVFDGENVERDRRVSIVCRDVPKSEGVQ